MNESPGEVMISTYQQGEIALALHHAGVPRPTICVEHRDAEYYIDDDGEPTEFEPAATLWYLSWGSRCAMITLSGGSLWTHHRSMDEFVHWPIDCLPGAIAAAYFDLKRLGDL